MGPTGTAGRNTRVSNPTRDATGDGGQPPIPPVERLDDTKTRGRGDSPPGEKNHSIMRDD